MYFICFSFLACLFALLLHVFAFVYFVLSSWLGSHVVLMLCFCAFASLPFFSDGHLVFMSCCIQAYSLYASYLYLLCMCLVLTGTYVFMFTWRPCCHALFCHPPCCFALRTPFYATVWSYTLCA